MTASYEIALLVAKNKKPYTIAEELIMPAAKVLMKHVIGDEAVSKLSSVPVSNNTSNTRCQITRYSGVLQKLLLILMNKSLRMYRDQNMD